MMGGITFMLPGQGSQKSGMGADLLGIGEVAESFVCASDAFGFDVAETIRTATSEELAQTNNAQASILALSVGIARALQARGIVPESVLGFSLGQIGALTVSGMLPMERMFDMAVIRAELMEEAVRRYPGGMRALLGGTSEEVDAAIDAARGDDVLVVANCNCPGQVVVSGHLAAIGRVGEVWAAQKKRSAVLATAGAFHSPLMEEAARAFGEYLQGVEFCDPAIPLICNVDASPLAAENARIHLAQHLVSPVLFDKSIELLIGQGCAEFVEIGYGGVLSGLVKRIDRQVPRSSVADYDSFQAFCDRCAQGALVAGGQQEGYEKEKADG